MSDNKESLTQGGCQSVKVEIDAGSGFCHGVVTAIRKAEEALASSETLYCLGDIVHNNLEVSRLESKGMKTITHGEMESLTGVRVLLRAHGEPPSTYSAARSRDIEIIDATCPVVLKLQQRIKERYVAGGSQIVIYGKPGHAEVNGLVGQTDGNAIVVQGLSDLDKIDYDRDVDLYSQTTMSLSGFKEIISEIRRRMSAGARFSSYDTICRQVANRVDSLKRFAASHSLVLFVSGAKSSNGKFLHSQCLDVNGATKLISEPSAIDASWLEGVDSIGICGATSTPRWLMELVKERVEQMLADTKDN